MIFYEVVVLNFEPVCLDSPGLSPTRAENLKPDEARSEIFEPVPALLE